MKIAYIEIKDKHSIEVQARLLNGKVVGRCKAIQAGEVITGSEFYVEKRVRRRGIGSEIFIRIERWGIEAGATRLAAIFDPDPDADFDAVKRFYEKRGFHVSPENLLITGELRKQ